MALRTLWNVLRSPERREAVFSGSASPALQTIFDGLQEHRRIVEHLKRYEDVTYTFVVRRFAFLREELAAIFQGPGKQVLVDRRVQERRRRADRRGSIAEPDGKGNIVNQPREKV